MRSLFSGISGLKVHQTKMDVIANNIANVNTVGFKSSRATFSDFFSQSLSGATAASESSGRGGTNPTQIGLGVSLASIDINMNPGLGQRTDKNTDLMISGSGFFIVSDNAGTYFTRAGAFGLDAAGNLVNSSGLQVMGWEVAQVQKEVKYMNPDGTEGTYYTTESQVLKETVSPIVIDGDKVSAPPETTTDVVLSGNLNAVTEPVKNTTMEVYDSLGTRYVIDVQFSYDEATGVWTKNMGNHAYVNGDRKNAVFLEFNGGNGVIDNPFGVVFGEEVVFNADGTLADTAQAFTIENPISEITFDALGNIETPLNWAMEFTVNEGALPANAKFGNELNQVSVDYTGLTQFDAKSTATTSSNGKTAGTLIDISIGKDGIIVGSYTNGTTRALNQIAIADFVNPAGLEKVGNNLFRQTMNSGTFDGVGIEITANGGSILGGVLEMSNVDLSSEFTEMITTQRGFQANSRTITTSDEMLQELVNLKR